MKVGEVYMWMADGFAYPHRVVIQDTEPDSQGRVRVCCYDNDGAIYVARADAKELKKVSVDVSQKGDSMHVAFTGITEEQMDNIARHFTEGVAVDDPVNHPSHYTNGSIECIDAMKAAFGSEELVSFCKLNAFKYIWRCKHKGAEIQDLEKASWYLNKAIELLKEEAESGMENKDILKRGRCNCDY